MGIFDRKVVPFLRVLYTFASPLSSVIIMIFGSAFFTTFMSLYLESKGYRSDQIGYVQSAYFLGMLVGAFQMEKIIKRIGHIQALAVFGSLATCATLLQLLWPNYIVWIVLRFLFGVCLAALYIVVESWMLHYSTVKTRGVVLALYMVSLYGAQSASQLLLKFIDLHSATPFLISALFTSLSVIPVGLSQKRITLPESQETIRLLSLVKISPFGSAGCFISGLILSGLFSFFPLFALEKNISSSFLMAITIGGGTLLQWPIGKLSDYLERRKTLLGVVLVALSLSFTIFFLHSRLSFGILTLSFLLGGFLFTLYPLSITQVCDHLDPEHLTRVTALLLVIYGFGSVFGPMLSSIIVGAFGIDYLFLYFILLLTILSIVGSYTTLRYPIIPLEEQGDFVPLPNVTPVAYEMDPRTDD